MQESGHQLEPASNLGSAPPVWTPRPAGGKSCRSLPPSKSGNTFSLFQPVLPRATQGSRCWESKVPLSHGDMTRHHRYQEEVSSTPRTEGSISPKKIVCFDLMDPRNHLTDPFSLFALAARKLRTKSVDPAYKGTDVRMCILQFIFCQLYFVCRVAPSFLLDLSHPVYKLSRMTFDGKVYTSMDGWTKTDRDR